MPSKFDRCVKKVQARGAANAYAVCTAAGTRNAARRSDIEDKIAQLELDIAEPERQRSQGPPSWAKKYPDDWAKTLRSLERKAEAAARRLPGLIAKRDAMIDRAKAEWERKGSPSRPQGKRGIRLKAVDSKGNMRKPGRKNIVPLGLTDVALLKQAEQRIRKAAGIGGKARGRRNPSKAEASREITEAFHGRPRDEVYHVSTKLYYPSDVAELGELTKLKVRSRRGVVTLDSFEEAVLSADPKFTNKKGVCTQLYVIGGDQSVDDLSLFGVDTSFPHAFEDLGEITEIRYYTIKEHLGDEGGEATYYHKAAEEDLAKRLRIIRRPHLIASVADNRLLIAGGAYQIEPEGISN